ncbi:MAG: hypothetical protein Q9186_000533 [Xanthomendoza sp. 1 TL-2023]
MGSSAKKRKDKKKDFQKPKLKVGKARPKPTNFTDTSFRSKGIFGSPTRDEGVTDQISAIVLNQQSLATTAPSTQTQFSHHVSLLSSRTDSQRRESLSYLTTAITTRPTHAPLQQPVSVLLQKLVPLTLDPSNGVRTQMLKLLRALPPSDVGDHINKVLLWLPVGLTHLAADIRSSTLDMLVWALECAGDALVSSAGGWVKTLKSLVVMHGWPMESRMGPWSSSKTAFGRLGEGKAMAKGLATMASFLRAGLAERMEEDVQPTGWGWPLTNTGQHMISRRSNCFAYLDLFKAPGGDDESQIYEDREDRQRVFARKFQKPIERGLEAAKQEGGEIGRAAASVQKAINEGMRDFDGST